LGWQKPNVLFVRTAFSAWHTTPSAYAGLVVWPRGAVFCLGLKICISSFRAAPGGQVISPQGLHMRNVK